MPLRILESIGIQRLVKVAVWRTVLYAVASIELRKDISIAPAGREARSAELEPKTITLDDAVAKGFTDFASIHADPDFAPLATMPGFAEREAKAAKR